MMESRCYWTLFYSSFLCLVVLSDVSYGCRPPSIHRQGRKVQYYANGQERIRCEAFSDTPIEYTWLKNDRRLDINESIIGFLDMNDRTNVYAMPDQNSRSGDLVINTNRLTEGMAHYQCRASNLCGTSVSVRTLLLRAVLDPFPVLLRPHDRRAYVGMGIRLPCIQPRSVPYGVVSWVLMSAEDPVNWSGMEAVQTNDRIVMNYEGTLFITYALEEDERNGRHYVCQVANRYTRNIVFGEDTTIFIDDYNSPQNQPAHLMWSSHSEMIGIVGRPSKMMCIFTGDPQPNTTWTREGAEFNDSRMARSRHELVISNVQPEDAGSYTCSASNGVGQVAQRTFTLTVHSAPSWQNTPSNFTIQPGQNIHPRFDCRATGNPTPVVSVYINGRPFEERPAHLDVSLQDNVLIFGNTTLTESLVVQCNASNSHGYIWADNYVYVQVPGAVTRIRERDNCGYHATLRWNEPENLVDQVTGYTLTYKARNNSTSQVIETLCNSALLTGLDADTEYGVYISPRTRMGIGEATFFLFKTHEEEWVFQEYCTLP